MQFHRVRKVLRIVGWLWFACVLAPVAHLLSAQSSIEAAVPSGGIAARFVLQQTSAARVYAHYDAGEIAPETRLRKIRVWMSQSSAKQGALHVLLAAQQERDSPLYHHWLLPEEYRARFGADTESIARITSWLRMSGMTEIEVARGGNFISFSASALTVESAFHVKLHAFVIDGERHYANTAAATLPEELRGIVAGMQGLDDFSFHSRGRASAHVDKAREAIAPAYVLSAGGVQSLGPGDLATIYDMKPLYQMGVDGKGVTIAVVGAVVPSLADYRAYRSRFGLAANDFQTVVVPGSIAGNAEADTVEAALDVEIAGAVAPGAAIVYVQDEDLSAAVAYTIDHRLADVLSISYTSCELPGPEDLAYETLALQGAVEGMTWVSATGDSGAAGCDPAGSAVALSGLAVNLPASLPEVTAVGGTMFAGVEGNSWSTTNTNDGTTALAYVPETAWNGIVDGETVTGGGGGGSRDFFKPGFQSSITDGIPGREVPDVAMAAEERVHPYLVISGGQTLFVGGTSAATPLFAGITALVNGYLLAQSSITASGLGNINPLLYRLGQTAPAVFHDVVTGTNEVACAPGSADCTGLHLGYAAGAGYDMATGLGSVDAYALAAGWNSAVFASSRTSLSAGGTASDGSVELKAIVTASGSPPGGIVAGGSVVFSWTNAGYFEGPTVFARIAVGMDGSAPTASGMLPGGSNQVTAEFEGTTDVLGSVSAPLTVNVQQSLVPAASVSLLDVQAEVAAGKYLPLAATVEGTNIAPTGEVSFYLQGSLVGSAPVVDGIAATLSTTPPLPGKSLLTARYGGDGTYAPAVSTGASLIVFAASALGQTPDAVTLRAAQSSIVFGTPLTLQAAVTGGSTMATGVITFYVGQTAVGPSVPLVNGAATASYASIAVGAQMISARYSGDASNQPAVSPPVSVVVSEPSAGTNLADFSLMVPSSITVIAGNGGSIPITLVPMGGFGAPIQLTCTGGMVGYSCSVPGTVTAQGATTVMAKLLSQAESILLFVPAFFLRKRPAVSGGASTACTAKLRTWGMLTGLIFLTGCGLTVNKGTTIASPGTYPITITATSGSLVHTAVVNVVLK